MRKYEAVTVSSELSAEGAAELMELHCVCKVRDLTLRHLTQRAHCSIFWNVATVIVSCSACLLSALRGEPVFPFFQSWTVGVG